MPVLFYLRSSVYLQNYYLLGQWPAHFMILGIGLDTAWHQHCEPGDTGRNGCPTSGLVSRGAGCCPMFLALVTYQVSFSRRYQDARAAGNGPDMQVRHARAIDHHFTRLAGMMRPGGWWASPQPSG